ncbi:acyl-CoA dehydrogenase family protein [Streptomyces sp. Li-HN-5-11]|uniref:acyl-CoA dehydrogenase family protein n=1 Tax=Streptomyces sp. Li-HN-5-11 TaxID=3075432 RepID=UPI0028AEED65|nr:acyl-CoA dehydrogenase family protein [Streptomyces sp. Li-HN-5-11]WNM31209.1 acyl-CoA dehydrogenase family protein [Streptomyces sp. Li-HN-5-11]
MIRHCSELDICDRFAALAADTVAKRAGECTKEGRLDRESWQEMSDAGVRRLAVPAKWGGEDGSWWDFVAAFEGMATDGTDLGFCLSVVAQAGLIRSLITYGTDEQRAYWLPRLLNGEAGATAVSAEEARNA